MVDLPSRALKDRLNRIDAQLKALDSRAPTGLFRTLSGASAPALTATVSNPTLGTGGVTSMVWTRVGDIVIIAAASWDFGSAGTGAGSGTYHLAVPFPADPGSYGRPIGRAYMVDYLVTSTPVDVEVDATGLKFTQTSGAAVTHASPVAWGVSDNARIGVCIYRALV